MEFLDKVEQSGKWPQQAWTTMFFLMPNPGFELGEGVRASRSLCGVSLGNTFQLPKEDLARSAVRVLRAPEASAVRRMCGGAAPDHHGILPGSEWSCLLLRIVLQDALSEVTKFFTPLKSRVFVDDITAHLKGNKTGKWRT